MLGLFESKGSKLATLIGQSLHGQILKGKERVGDDFMERLNSPFTSSYIYSFIAKSFDQANYDSDAMAGKHLKTICEGIWPGVITQLIEKDAARLELVNNLDDPRLSDEIREFKLLFESGRKRAESDVLLLAQGELPLGLFNFIVEGLSSSDVKSERGREERKRLRQEKMSTANLPVEPLQQVETQAGESDVIKIDVPDIGDFKDVPIIEVFVKKGDQVEEWDSLITLESDKATMDIPSPVSGVVDEIHVRVNDRVSEGQLIASVNPQGKKEDASLSVLNENELSPLIAAVALRINHAVEECGLTIMPGVVSKSIFVKAELLYYLLHMLDRVAFAEGGIELRDQVVDEATFQVIANFISDEGVSEDARDKLSNRMLDTFNERQETYGSCSIGGEFPSRGTVFFAYAFYVQREDGKTRRDDVDDILRGERDIADDEISDFPDPLEILEGHIKAVDLVTNLNFSGVLKNYND